MTALGVFYIEQGVADHYNQQIYVETHAQLNQLNSYVKSRRGYETDRLAFVALGHVSQEEYDDNDSPWVNTRLGWVRFDSDGFITALCLDPSGSFDECPPMNHPP